MSLPARPTQAWGRLARPRAAVLAPTSREAARRALAESAGPRLAVGLGRSYGDVGLLGGGTVLDMRGLDRLLQADWESGIVRAEAGLSLDALLRIAVPKGWFVPVTPGTRFVTLGGAVANDVHGKNHHGAGTFGRHVTRLALARSTGEVLELGPDSDELFAATVGGLGLTGAILWVELRLQRIVSAWLDVETLPMGSLDDFFALNAESVADWPYTVAWVDCLATGADVGRGLYMRARPSQLGDLDLHRAPKLSVPMDAPGFLLNPLSIGAFNRLYRWRPWARGLKRTHYQPFFYPLDGIDRWNRLYGPAGFYQHQCIVPTEAAPDVLRRLLELSASFRQGSFLIVLKTFGDLPSPGVLSFPRPGATLALDFPNKGDGTRRLLDRMNAIAVEAGGRLYPAKDATMTAAAFRASYPDWERVEKQRDPAILSDFWRRVTGIA